MVWTTYDLASKTKLKIDLRDWNGQSLNLTCDLNSLKRFTYQLELWSRIYLTLDLRLASYQTRQLMTWDLVTWRSSEPMYNVDFQLHSHEPWASNMCGALRKWFLTSPHSSTISINIIPFAINVSLNEWTLDFNLKKIDSKFLTWMDTSTAEM